MCVLLTSTENKLIIKMIEILLAAFMSFPSTK